MKGGCCEHGPRKGLKERARVGWNDSPGDERESSSPHTHQSNIKRLFIFVTTTDMNALVVKTWMGDIYRLLFLLLRVHSIDTLPRLLTLLESDEDNRHSSFIDEKWIKEKGRRQCILVLLSFNVSPVERRGVMSWMSGCTCTVERFNVPSELVAEWMLTFFFATVHLLPSCKDSDNEQQEQEANI